MKPRGNVLDDFRLPEMELAELRLRRIGEENCLAREDGVGGPLEIPLSDNCFLNTCLVSVSGTWWDTFTLITEIKTEFSEIGQETSILKRQIA